MTAVLEQTFLGNFVSQLPAYARTRLNVTAQVIANVHRAEQHGWTVKQLVEQCVRNHNGAINTGGIIAHRLAGCALSGPNSAENAKPKVHHGCGCGGAGFIYDETTDPVKVTRCPGKATD